jgi:hypothetical protein
MFQLSPGRHADRLFSSALEVMEATRGPSAYATGILSQFLEEALEGEEGMTQDARDAATYAARFGYAIRLVEEAEGTAHRFDAGTVRRLHHARQEAPGRRKALLDAALAESQSEADRAFLKRLHAAGGDEYAGENEILEELVRGEGWSRWFEGRTFFKLSGYDENVWQMVALKAGEAP